MRTNYTINESFSSGHHPWIGDPSGLTHSLQIWIGHQPLLILFIYLDTCGLNSVVLFDISWLCLVIKF